MKTPRSAIHRVTEACLELKIRSAAVFIAPDHVVRATYMHKPFANSRSIALVVKIGKPNYAEREFIKDCLAAGEKFPIRKLQLRWFPAKKGAK